MTTKLEMIEESYAVVCKTEEIVRRTDRLGLIAAALAIIAATVLTSVSSGLGDGVGALLATVSGFFSGYVIASARHRKVILSHLRASYEAAKREAA